MKKELKAASLEYSKTWLDFNNTEEASRDGFVEGAKWQQKQMYSKEEVLQLLVRAVTEEYDNLNEWFEQFKKK